MSRIGIGFDSHRFDSSRPLVLGGVTIPGGPGLAGHSDADVLCHAVADALLGAAAQGDLGSHFPDDAKWQEASSLDILSEVKRIVDRAGWSVGNVDVVVIAEAPALAPHRDEMATNIARVLEVDARSVSVKATTTDGLGFSGRREGIAAIAVVLVH